MDKFKLCYAVFQNSVALVTGKEFNKNLEVKSVGTK